MPKVKLLVQGYGRQEGEQEFASAACTLIQDNNLNIIVDPGLDRRKLLDALVRENLKPEDINYVVLTHSHPDHALLTGIFAKASVLDNEGIYFWDGKISEHEGKAPGTDIAIIKTPGHDPFHCSLLVKTEDKGKVAIAGDVFWWWDHEEQKTDPASLLARPDPYVKNKKELQESRQKLLDLADYIIPGHGKIFKVSK